MKTSQATREDFQQIWTDLPRAFRETHPVPAVRDHTRIAAWMNAVHKDSEAEICAILDASIAYCARGDTAAAHSTAQEARPFRAVMRALDVLAAAKGAR